VYSLRRGHDLIRSGIPMVREVIAWLVTKARIDTRTTNFIWKGRLYFCRVSYVVSPTDHILRDPNVVSPLDPILRDP
jgi:hypothetical protein